jgi:gluconokinase
LLNRHTLTWDQELLAALDSGADLFNQPLDVEQAPAQLHGEYARRWPMLANLPWYGAIGDGAAANLGSDCADPARIALTIGTTAAVRLVLPHVDQVPTGLWCYLVDRRRALLGGATSEGGNIYAWLKQLLNLGDPARLEAALASAEPDSHGLTILPFVAGERSPGYAGDIGASIVGLRLSTGPIEIVRAALEAVAYRLALIVRLLQPALGAAQSQVIATGGALRSSSAWAQLIADVLGAPLAIAPIDEASARGAALLALAALDQPPPPLLQSAHVYQPNAQSYARYQEAIARQQELYRRMIG